jgi:hypothetical protein
MPTSMVICSKISIRKYKLMDSLDCVREELVRSRSGEKVCFQYMLSKM